MFSDKPPQDDSPDLTDAEIDSCTVTTSVGHFAEVLRGLSGPVLRVHYDLRRRAPHTYIRVTLDDNPLLLQVDWLNV